MKALVSALTLGLVVAFSVPAFAAEKPKDAKAECLKNHGTWNKVTKTCTEKKAEKKK